MWLLMGTVQWEREQAQTAGPKSLRTTARRCQKGCLTRVVVSEYLPLTLVCPRCMMFWEA